MNKEHFGGLIFLLTGVYGLIFSHTLPMGRWNEPGPGAFPFVLAVLLAFSGIMVIARAKGKKEEKQKGWDFLRNLLTPFYIVLLTLGFILTLERVGYVASTLVYLFILFFGVCRYKLPLAAGMAAVFGLGSWYFFVKILGVQLPLTFLGI